MDDDDGDDEEIEGDLYYDNSRQELQVEYVDEGWGSDFFDETCLRVLVQEIPEEDQEVDESEHSDEEE